MQVTEISSFCSVELGKAAYNFKEPDIEVDKNWQVDKTLKSQTRSSIGDSIESFVTGYGTAAL